MAGRIRKTVFALGGCALALISATGSAQGSGRFVPTPPFASVSLGGPDSLRFFAGPRSGVIVGPGDRDQAGSAALVRDGTLRVASGRRYDLLAATAPTLRSAVVNGTGDLDVGGISGPSFEGVVRGPGRLTVAALRVPEARIVNDGVGDLTVRALDADTLVVEMRGPGDVRVSGAARSVSIVLYGTGDCDARGLAAGDLTVTAIGSGNVQARSSRTARINASGTGSVVVNGHPQCSVRATGVGEVVCG